MIYFIKNQLKRMMIDKYQLNFFTQFFMFQINNNIFKKLKINFLERSYKSNSKLKFTSIENTNFCNR